MHVWYKSILKSSAVSWSFFSPELLCWTSPGIILTPRFAPAHHCLMSPSCQMAFKCAFKTGSWASPPIWITEQQSSLHDLNGGTGTTLCTQPSPYTLYTPRGGWKTSMKFVQVPDEKSIDVTQTKDWGYLVHMYLRFRAIKLHQKLLVWRFENIPNAKFPS